MSLDTSLNPNYPKSKTMEISSRQSSQLSLSSQKSFKVPKSAFFDTPSNSGQTTPKKSAVTPNPTEPSYVASVFEYRNQIEIGMAVMNVHTTKLLLYQFCDTNSYHRTMSLLAQYEPIEILIPDVAQKSVISQKIGRGFDFSRLRFLQRKYFNESLGSAMLKNLCTEESCMEFRMDASKFLCLCAASACLKYLEFNLNANFAPGSIRLAFKSLEGFVKMTAQTATDLELVKNKNNQKARDGTLFGLMDLCKTSMGSRLLRTNLFQPLNEVNTLESRLDCVEKLLENEDVIFVVGEKISEVVDFEKIVAALCRIPKIPTDSSRQLSLMNALNLRRNIIVIRSVSESLKKINNQLIEQISTVLAKEDGIKVCDNIDKVLDKNVFVGQLKKGNGALQTQLAFSVKSGIEPMLDVARATYKEVVEDIHREVILYKEAVPEVGTLKIQFNVSRGYHLALLTNELERLPDAFIQRRVSNRRVYCTTDNLLSLESRRRECFSEILKISHEVMQKMLGSLRIHTHWFQLVSEAVALLDMMMAFASLSLQRPNYTRPNFTADGPIALQESRHPVVEICSLNKFTANDIFQTENSNFYLISGPNASGKSTFLQQICVLTIMAHIGCYVPAEFASFRIVDQIFTRFANGDDFEANQSTFYKEMLEVAHIIRNVSDRSLVAIDELGRETSSIDGIALAWATSERLIQTKSFCLFTTHYFELTRLSEIYPNVKHKTLQIDVSGKSGFRYVFKLIDGDDAESDRTVENYGIYIAKAAGFPKEIIIDAKAYSHELTRHLDRFRSKKQENGLMSKAFLLADQLIGIKYTTLSEEEISKFLFINDCVSFLFSLKKQNKELLEMLFD